MEEGRKHIDLIADSVALENGRKARRERDQKRVGKGKRRKRRGRGKCGQKQALELEQKYESGWRSLAVFVDQHSKQQRV